jgi:hypothetical protein
VAALLLLAVIALLHRDGRYHQNCIEVMLGMGSHCYHGADKYGRGIYFSDLIIYNVFIRTSHQVTLDIFLVKLQLPKFAFLDRQHTEEEALRF